MFVRFTGYGLSYMITVLLVTLPGGCSRDQASTGKTHDTAKPITDDAANHAALVAKLAKADQIDGQADKIVGRCASCALSMDGKPDHALKVLDYTLYFCKEACAQLFAKNMTKSVLAMKIPESLPAPDADQEDAKQRADTHAKIMAKLAAADLLDGKADKTVVRCASCALGMDGIAEHALQAHGYTLHFCQANCAQRFGKDIQGSVLAMEIPEN